MIKQQMKESIIPNTTMFVVEENKEKYYEFIPNENYLSSSYSVLLNEEDKIISARRTFNTIPIRCNLDYDFKNTASFKTAGGTLYTTYGNMEYCAVLRDDIAPKFVSKDKANKSKETNKAEPKEQKEKVSK